jgi:hypothetical protein
MSKSPGETEPSGKVPTTAPALRTLPREEGRPLCPSTVCDAGRPRTSQPLRAPACLRGDMNGSVGGERKAARRGAIF